MGEKPGDGGDSFEDRLRAARSRQKLDASVPVPGSDAEGIGGSPWGIGLRVGVEMVSALVVGVAIGWALDRWFGTRPILLGVFVLLGGAAGVLNVWRSFAPKA